MGLLSALGKIITAPIEIAIDVVNEIVEKTEEVIEEITE